MVLPGGNAKSKGWQKRENSPGDTGEAGILILLGILKGKLTRELDERYSKSKKYKREIEPVSTSVSGYFDSAQ